MRKWVSFQFPQAREGALTPILDLIQPDVSIEYMEEQKCTSSTHAQTIEWTRVSACTVGFYFCPQMYSLDAIDEIRSNIGNRAPYLRPCQIKRKTFRMLSEHKHDTYVKVKIGRPSLSPRYFTVPYQVPCSEKHNHHKRVSKKNKSKVHNEWAK